MNFIFSSCGNDSVALIQWMAENKPLDQNIVVYSDTGWAAPFWIDRVNRVKKWVNDIGLSFIRTESEGMIDLVRRKKGWPMPASPMQFCTDELKAKPARELMLKLDPELKGKCFTGVRREESQNRKNAPAYIEQSERHGGRDLYSPLIEYTESDRNELLSRASFEPLPHNSMECFPCVCANREDLRMLVNYQDRVQEIADAEKEMGFTKNGKPRVMFRPYRHMGAIGIHEVLEWATANKGKYFQPSDGQINFESCTSGFCST